MKATACIRVFADTDRIEQCQARLSSFQTAGGKAGVAWQDWLAYGVGGFAWGSTPSQSFFPGGAIADVTTTPTHHGWYAGAGFD